MKAVWLSSTRMTVLVLTDEAGIIRSTPPVVRVFRGQPLPNLIRWMSRQGGFQLHRYEGDLA